MALYSCLLVQLSARTAYGLVVALMARDRDRRAEEAAAQQPPSHQCEGITLTGRRCLLTSLHSGSNAAPLREGGTRCIHHRLDTFTGMQCEGITSRGTRCWVFSAAGYTQARPLQRGFKYCSCHALQACAAGVVRGHHCQGGALSCLELGPAPRCEAAEGWWLVLRSTLSVAGRVRSRVLRGLRLDGRPSRGGARHRMHR